MPQYEARVRITFDVSLPLDVETEEGAKSALRGMKVADILTFASKPSRSEIISVEQTGKQYRVPTTVL